MYQKVKQTNRYLITGTSSGLGKYLFEFFGGTSFTRESTQKEIEKLKQSGVDVIIHAAFNSTNDVTSDNLYSYIEDNILLTQNLLNIPNKKFVFISSVDVYPKDNKKHAEEELINLNQIKGIYGITKLISECLVKENTTQCLILRCSALLGKYSRKNTLTKIVEERNPVLTLSSQSSVNFISYYVVSDFIKIALEKNLQGVYNLTSSENITVSQIVDLLRKEVQFGNYTYNAGNINASKSNSILPRLKKTSLETINEFLNSLNGK